MRIAGLNERKTLKDAPRAIVNYMFPIDNEVIPGIAAVAIATPVAVAFMSAGLGPQLPAGIAIAIQNGFSRGSDGST